MSKKHGIKTESPAPTTPIEPTAATAPAQEAPSTKQVFFALGKDLETMFKVFDQPKQVRDICKILLRKGELSKTALLEEMGNGAIKTRQNPEHILTYYLNTLTTAVGVTVQSR